MSALRVSLYQGIVLVAILYGYAGFLTLHDDHYWGDDWAQYLAHAENLVSGKPYGQTGYLFNDQVPGIGPAVTQPGLPFLLAPVYALFGFDLIALKASEFVLLMGGIGLLALVLARLYGPTVALVATAVFALHPMVLIYRQVILSEPAFLIFSFLALYLAEVRDAAVSNRRVILLAVMTGMAMIAAYSTRTIGMVLPVVLLVRDLLSGRAILIRTVPAVAVFAAGAFVIQSLNLTASYTTQLITTSSIQSQESGFLTRVAQRMQACWQSFSAFWSMPFGMSWVISIIIMVCFVWSIVRFAQTGLSKTGAGWLSVRWMAAIPLPLWYAGAYLSGLVLLPVYPEPRLLMPVLPVLLAAAVASVISVTHRVVKNEKVMSQGLLILVVIYMGLLNVRADRGGLTTRLDSTEGDNGAFCADCKLLYAYIQSNTEPAARIAFAKPKALAFLAQRSALGFSKSSVKEDLLSAFKLNDIRYLVVVRAAHVLADEYPSYISWQGIEDMNGLTVRYENHDFRMFELPAW